MPRTTPLKPACIIGIARRKVLEHIGHFHVTELWIQDKTRSQIIQVARVPGTENMADALTNYVDKASLASATSRMHMVKTNGRSATAPTAMGE